MGVKLSFADSNTKGRAMKSLNPLLLSAAVLFLATGTATAGCYTADPSSWNGPSAFICFDDTCDAVNVETECANIYDVFIIFTKGWHYSHDLETNERVLSWNGRQMSPQQLHRMTCREAYAGSCSGLDGLMHVVPPM